jgi:hypothetical protein
LVLELPLGSQIAIIKRVSQADEKSSSDVLAGALSRTLTIGVNGASIGPDKQI